ncbi:facilitated trehalose transporter Tret1-2 homolog [Schistocerca americana]|uniref:facilitated trehalose transporter Tret1-2 homolog n=1 Tax=Schistocerca americana TaxID=7009 RepID=UPI001F4F596B|nr:facilitated trehalose transporter Tret1-2 homolog [Schistocerca americana]
MDADRHDERSCCISDPQKVEVQAVVVNCQELKSLNNVYEPTTVQVETAPALPQIFATAAAMSFHIVVGVSLAFSAILVPSIMKEADELNISKSQASWLASSLVLFVPVGTMTAGCLMESYGRLNAIKMAAIPSIVGWALIGSGQSFVPLLIGRMLTGIGTGMGSSPAVVYTTEIAKPEIRGALTSAGATLASLGMLIIYGEGALLHWRTCSWLSMIYIIVPIILVWTCIPESPVWLIARGRVDEAEASLKWFGGKNKSLHKRQLAAMVRSQDMRALAVSSFPMRMKSFLKPTGYKPLGIMFVLFIVQQFSGIYITLFYAINFFEDIGTEIDPNLATVFLGMVRFGMSVANTILLKHFGRRTLCFFSCFGMSISMILSGFSTMYIMNGGGLTWIPVVCVLAYVCTSMSGLLSIPWIMTAELFPTEIRGIAHGIVMSFGYLAMFAAIQCYFDMLYYFGGAHVLQWFFAGMSLLGAVHVWIFLPETHSVTLSSIEQYFKENIFYCRYIRKQAREAAPNL